MSKLIEEQLTRFREKFGIVFNKGVQADKITQQNIEQFLKSSMERVEEETKKKIKDKWHKLNIIGGGAVGSSQGIVINNPWGETEYTQVDRESFKQFVNSLQQKEE